MSTDGCINHNNPTKNQVNKLLVVGVAALDTCVPISQFPKPDDKIRANVNGIYSSGGGNAANTAVAMSRMVSSSYYIDDDNNNDCNSATMNTVKTSSWKVDLVALVGNDSNGDTILDELTHENIGIHPTIQRYDGPSPWTYIMIHESTRTCIHHPPSIQLSLDHAMSIFNDSGGSAITTSISTSNTTTSISIHDYYAAHFDGRYPEVALYIASQCYMNHIPYSIDVERPREGLAELLRHASVVICNERYCDLVWSSSSSSSSSSHTTTMREEQNQKIQITQRFKYILETQSPMAKIGVMTMGSKGSCLIILGDHHHDNHTNSRDDTSTTSSIILDDNNKSLNVQNNDNHNEHGENDTPIVTKEYGSLWCPAWKNCDVIDTTGAGDAFQGGFLSTLWMYTQFITNHQHPQTVSSSLDSNQTGSLLAGRRIQIPTDEIILAHALRIGTRVASKKLEAMGARNGIPKNDSFIRSEIRDMLRYGIDKG